MQRWSREVVCAEKENFQVWAESLALKRVVFKRNNQLQVICYQHDAQLGTEFQEIIFWFILANVNKSDFVFSFAGSKIPDCSKMRKYFFSILKNTESRLFGKYLLLTNTVSSGLLMYIGEVAAQTLDKSQPGDTKYDKEKIKQLTVVGISQGPLHHYTYLWMERVLPGNAMKTVFKKILCDQVNKLWDCIISQLLLQAFLF